MKSKITCRRNNDLYILPTALLRFSLFFNALIVVASQRLDEAISSKYKSMRFARLVKSSSALTNIKNSRKFDLSKDRKDLT